MTHNWDEDELLELVLQELAIAPPDPIALLMPNS
jgi:hypothetical protein